MNQKTRAAKRLLKVMRQPNVSRFPLLQQSIVSAPTALQRGVSAASAVICHDWHPDELAGRVRFLRAVKPRSGVHLKSVLYRPTTFACEYPVC